MKLKKLDTRSIAGPDLFCGSDHLQYPPLSSDLPSTGCPYHLFGRPLYRSQCHQCNRADGGQHR